MPAFQPLIKVTELSASYGWGHRRKAAINNLDFEVGAGEIFSLIGPNGAGKTTIVRVLLGVLLASRGSISVLGYDPATQRTEIVRRAGVIIDGVRSLEPRLTGLENLIKHAVLMELPWREALARARWCLAEYGLPENVVVNRFSRGMRQRLILCAAMVGNPSLLILDEPTLGLDVKGMERLKVHMADLCRRGGAVLFTSQELGFVESVSTNVLVIGHDGVVAKGSVAEVARELGHETVIELLVSDPDLLNASMLPAGWTLTRRGIQGKLGRDMNLAAIHKAVRAMGTEVVGVRANPLFEQHLSRGES